MTTQLETLSDNILEEMALLEESSIDAGRLLARLRKATNTPTATRSQWQMALLELMRKGQVFWAENGEVSLSIQ